MKRREPPPPGALTEEDRGRYLELKATLLEKLRRARADSEVVYQCALHVGEIEDRRYYVFDDVGDMGAWAKKCRVRQASKYRNIRRGLTAEEVRGRRVGVEALNEVSLTPRGLHKVMWRLADDEELSVKALLAGRLAAEGPWLQGREQEAAELLERKALQVAARDEKPCKPRAAGERTSLAEQIEARMKRLHQQLVKLVTSQKLSAGEASALAEQAERLGALAEPLRSRPQGAENAEPVVGPRQSRATSVRPIPSVEDAPPELVEWLRGLPRQRQGQFEAACMAAVQGEGSGQLAAELWPPREPGREVAAAPEVAQAWLEALEGESGDRALLRVLRLCRAAQVTLLPFWVRLLRLRPLSAELAAEVEGLAAA